MVELGAHLPLIDFDGRPRTAGDLSGFARRAAALGYRYLCANDHLLFARPWLDGPLALAAAEASGDMTIATTVALPVIRGPVQTAQTLAALDALSGGRLVAGLGPGSSARDYAAAGVPFAERWGRFDDAVRAVRALLEPGAGVHTGPFYSTEGVDLQPRPAREHAPPIWIASAYNTTPEAFRAGLDALALHRTATGKPPAAPNAIATMWLHVTESRREADGVLRDVLAPLLDRPVEALRALALPIGPAELCAERIGAYVGAGAQRLFVWPLGDEIAQLEALRERVIPLVAGT
jgi:alkanesulfonate monooxygenase SsuD/methylene tetrahydromethanopterin reductase-like flavin-dependent oxidoreductase (luciferase family)